MDAFAVFLDIYNTHETPVKFKSYVSISGINYLDTTDFKGHNNSKALLTKAVFKPTVTPTTNV